MPRGILGFNSEMFKEYLHFIATEEPHKLVWMSCTLAHKTHSLMSEMLDLRKERTFETRVTEYQTGGALDWDRNN